MIEASTAFLLSFSAAAGWWCYYSEVRWRLNGAWLPLITAWIFTILSALRLALIVLQIIAPH